MRKSESDIFTFDRYETDAGHSGYFRSSTTTGYQLVRDDVTRVPVVDGWRKPTDYSCSGYEIKPIVGYYRYGHSKNISFDEGYCEFVRGSPFIKSAPYVSGVRERLEAQAIVRARNALADRRAGFSESIAEARSTVVGIANNAKTLQKFADAWYEGNTAKMASALSLSKREARHAHRATVAKGMGSAWLNYWFGLKPVVSDMVSGIAFLSDEEVHNSFRVHGRGRAEEVVTSSKTYEGVRFWYARGVMKQSTSTRYRAQCNIWAKPNTDMLRKLGAYGLYDVEQTLWAVTPYSFVVDWVIPVSEVLRSHSALRGTTYQGGDVTWSNKGTCDVTLSLTPLYNPGLWHAFVRPGQSVFHGMSRKAYNSRPPNSYRLWVKDPIDAWKATTALALLADAIDRPLRKFKFITK